MQQSNLAFLGCSSVRVVFSRCFRGNLKTRFQISFESLSSINYLVKQFGLSDATERLSLFRLWLCENFKTLFQILQAFRSSLNLTPSRSSEAFSSIGRRYESPMEIFSFPLSMLPVFIYQTCHARGHTSREKFPVDGCPWLFYLLGLFQTSWYCPAKLARLQHDTCTTWFQTSYLIQSNRTAVAENKTQKYRNGLANF